MVDPLVALDEEKFQKWLTRHKKNRQLMGSIAHIQYTAIQSNPIQFNSMHYNAMQCYAIQQLYCVNVLVGYSEPTNFDT